MENNPTLPRASTPDPPTPSAAPITPVPPQAGDKKMAIFMILGIIVILLVVGSIYFVLSKRQAATQPSSPAADTTSTDALEKDAAAVDVSSPDADFKSVDTDLGNL